MKTVSLSRLISGALLMWGALSGVQAQHYSIGWSKIGGGGGSGVKGPYTLNGTIGQPDANGTANVAPYSVTSGFWAFLGEQSSNMCITVTCSNLVVDTCGSSALVDYAVTVSDTCCSTAPMLTFNPPAGYNFPLGTTEVSVTASDNCGNEASNDFSVTVVRGNCSSSNCITINWSNTVVYACGSCAMIPFTAVAVDECCSDDNPTIEYFLGSEEIPSNYCFAVGTTNAVAVVAYDSCSALTNHYTVEVLPEGTPPSIDCPTNMVVYTGCTTAQIYYDVTASSPGCSNVSVTVAPPSGTFFPVGTNVVTVVATGCCGYSSNSFMVTVIQSNGCMGGQTWEFQPGFEPTLGQISDYAELQSMASSSDGRILAVAEYLSATVAISTNYGVTWTATTVESGSGAGYDAIACSADGSTMYFASGQGEIYVSTDTGNSWTYTGYTTSAGNRWDSVACSTDGSKVIIAATYTSTYGQGSIALSTNYGQTWTLANVLGGQTGYWGCVASSADGTKLAAATQGEPPGFQIYTSVDGGSTWQSQSGISAYAPNFVGIASSSDGSRLVAVSSFITTTNYHEIPGEIIVSTNYGTNWSQANAPGGNWLALASSASGDTLLAGSSSNVYVSSDAGGTWTSAKLPVESWSVVASSADGSRLAAGATGEGEGSTNNGLFYTSTCSLVQCCVPPPANMALWLPFDETNGNVSANLASPAYHGLQVGNPTPLIGSYVDNSLVFTGTNYVAVPDYSGIDIGTNSMTIDAWINPMPTSITNTVLAKFVTNGNTITGYDFGCAAYDGNGLSFLMSGNGEFQYFRSPTAITPGSWHFIAVTVNQNPAAPSGYFYVDGALAGTFTPTPANLSNTNALWVGTSQSGPSSQPTVLSFLENCMGALDEVEIYSRALSTNELYSIYIAGAAGKCKPCCYLEDLSISLVAPQTIEVNWGGCGVLESTTNLAAPTWTPIQNAASPYITPATGVDTYYRLQCTVGSGL